MATVNLEPVEIEGVPISGAPQSTFLVRNYLIPNHPEAKIGKPFKMKWRTDSAEKFFKKKWKPGRPCLVLLYKMERRPADTDKDRTKPVYTFGTLHPSWAALIEYCSKLGHGEIERLVIQDGVPVFAEQTRKKVKFPG